MQMQIRIGAYLGVASPANRTISKGLQNHAITSLCGLSACSKVEIRQLPQRCNAPYIPFRNTLNTTTKRKTHANHLAVRFFLWINPARGGNDEYDCSSCL